MYRNFSPNYVAIKKKKITDQYFYQLDQKTKNIMNES